MSKGGNTVQFFYGPDRKRFKRIDNTVAKGTVTTIYAAGKSYERIQDANGTRVKHYIGGFAVVTQTVGATSPFQTSYLHKDHLGSTDTITDESGQVIQRMSFDTWGKRREINWQALSASVITNFNTDITTRGYTGHEQIDEVGLIHMNGRVYDAELGRFLSADPNVQAPDNLQNWNRYSYVLNNPMSYTDPTGYFFSKLFKSIGRALGKAFSAIGRVFKKALQNPLVRAVLQIVVCSYGPYACAAAAAAMSAIEGGSIGDALKAAAFSYVGGEVFGAVGDLIDKFNIVAQSFVHGIVNGALTAAQGGNFLVGFASGAIGKLGGLGGQRLFGSYGSKDGVLGRAFISGISGCVGAVVSGGKCANGAVSAAFASMYNGDGIGKRASGLGKAIGNLIYDTLFYPTSGPYGNGICMGGIVCGPGPLFEPIDVTEAEWMFYGELGIAATTIFLPGPPIHKHHVFNKFRGSSPKSQKYRDFFKDHGINVDDFTVAVTKNEHTKLHQAGSNWTTQ